MDQNSNSQSPRPTGPVPDVYVPGGSGQNSGGRMPSDGPGSHGMIEDKYVPSTQETVSVFGSGGK